MVIKHKDIIFCLKKISQLQNPWGLFKHSRDLLIACHVSCTLSKVSKFQLCTLLNAVYWSLIRPLASLDMAALIFLWYLRQEKTSPA